MAGPIRSQGSCVSVSTFISPRFAMQRPCRADVSVGPPRGAAGLPRRDHAVISCHAKRSRFLVGNCRFLDLRRWRPRRGRDVRKSSTYRTLTIRGGTVSRAVSAGVAIADGGCLALSWFHARHRAAPGSDHASQVGVVARPGRRRSADPARRGRGRRGRREGGPLRAAEEDLLHQRPRRQRLPQPGREVPEDPGARRREAGDPPVARRARQPRQAGEPGGQGRRRLRAGRAGRGARAAAPGVAGQRLPAADDGLLPPPGAGGAADAAQGQAPGRRAGGERHARAGAEAAQGERDGRAADGAAGAAPATRPPSS